MSGWERGAWAYVCVCVCVGWWRCWVSGVCLVDCGLIDSGLRGLEVPYGSIIGGE